MATLQELRNRIKQLDQKSENFTTDNAIYPFWNLKDGAESIIRFLPDQDPNNTFFWVERLLIKLPFNSTLGDTDNKPVTVNVPCVEMFGQTCPILSEVRNWFKDKSLEEMGKRYWKKRSYIFQGFVTEDGVNENAPPENPIRRFIIGPQIFQLIKASLLDPELEELPTDYTHGLDFRLKKTSKGGFADYATSSWSRRERSLTSQERDSIEQFGLSDLSTFLPRKPTPEDMVVMKEMFEASVNGEAYNPEWSKHFKAFGDKSTDDVKVETKKVSTPKVEQTVEVKATVKEPEPKVEEPAKEEAKTDSDNRAQEILKMIRSRQK